MTKFRYLHDPIFVSGCALYAFNRWLIKPHTSIPIFHDWFNDLLLIPCALPPLLWLHRRLKLRAHDGPPTPSEVLGHLAFWALLFEFAGPWLMPLATGDWMDCVAYALGAALGFAGWRRSHANAPAPSS